MLALTPEVESALRWFHWTHTITVIPFVGVRYTQTHLPTDGGIDAQDAWLTQALAHLRDIHNDVLAEQTEAYKAAKQKATDPE